MAEARIHSNPAWDRVSVASQDIGRKVMRNAMDTSMEPRRTAFRPVSRAGLIVNPSSGKNSGKGLALADRIRHDPSITVRILERFDQITGFIDDMARDDVSDLFISSGDGTIQEILTQIAERKPFRLFPRLSLLPHGTTNLTAADLGLRHRSITAQAEFIRDVRLNTMRDRPTIRCANPRDGRPRHGMFVGTGAVAAATQFCQEAFNSKGVKGNWATFATLASAVSKTAFSKPDPTDHTRLDRPFDIAIDADGQRYADGQQLLQMSTTLDTLILNTKPFWGGKTGPIRTTVFPYPVPSVFRWLLPMMYGAETRKAPEGAMSFCSEKLQITSSSMFVIDGEFFAPPADEPLELQTGPVFTYLCG